MREDYSRDAKLRARVDALASGNRPLADDRFADLSTESRAWNEERRHLKARHGDRICGGLTCGEVEKLILRHQAGAIDQGVFLLAHEWRLASESTATSPVLVRAAVALVDLALRSGQLRLLRHLAKAARFLAAYADKPKRRASIGFADWWKLHALLFILKHPRTAYRTRDLRAHLAAHGLDVSAKEIRRFCTRYGIARDMRAGRPRKSRA